LPGEPEGAGGSILPAFRILKRNVIGPAARSFRVAFQPLGARSSRVTSARAAPLRQRSMLFVSAAPATLVEFAHDQPWRLHVGLTVKLDVLVMITVVAFVSAIVLGAF
jgi:hypothetical protein